MPAFQSLPLRLKARRFQLASKATHGEARTVAEDMKKRETRVGKNIVKYDDGRKGRRDEFEEFGCWTYSSLST